MQITNHDVIKSGEQELIDAITADLDWGTIEEIFSQAHQLKIEDNVEYKNGDIVVYNGQVAYKLEFDVNIVLAVLLDREGNYISVTSSGDLNPSQAKNEEDRGQRLQEESEDGSEAASAKIDSPDISGNDDEAAPLSDGDDAQEKISQTVSQAEEIMAEIEAEDQAVA